ncbi:MAG: hypothetical protein M1814_006008 [Vezdaea aestivalis]|nr:MAG: hypothetical protein M1814_006008 [Vezdaea aestivalis]
MSDQPPPSGQPEADNSMQTDADLDPSLEAEIDMTNTAPPNASDLGNDGTGDIDPVAPAAELRLPSKKDISLREFLSKMDDYAPIIPDAVTNFYLTKAGLPPPPHTSTHLSRLLALATQKFIADIAADAYQYSRIRSSNSSSNNPMGSLGVATGFPMAGQPGAAGAAGGAGGAAVGGAKENQGKSGNLGIQRPGYGGGGQGGAGQGRTVLTMEDLGMAVGEYGVNIKRGEFYR